MARSVLFTLSRRTGAMDPFFFFSDNHFKFAGISSEL